MKRIVTIVTAIMLLCSTYTGAENISGSWVGTLEAGSATLKVVFNIQKDANGKEYCTMDSPDQSAKGFPATLLYLSADSVSIKLPALNISYNGKLTDGEIKGIFSQNGMNLTLNLKPGVVEYVRPQTPAEPYPYQTKEVTFTNPDENVILSGTITYPVGYKESDNTPILLMVSGSGGQDRDSELYGHKLFLVIADYLARNGIATLRYDDRAIGRSTGRYQAATTQVVADEDRKSVV